MKKKILEQAKEISVIEEADVVVIGGGPGGLPAAVAAARRGAKTVLIERYGVLGGLATSGLMGPFFGYAPVAKVSNEVDYSPEYNVRAEKPILGGIPLEIVRRLQRIGGAYGDEEIDWYAVRFDPELLKFVCDDIVEEANVKLILHAWVVGTVVEDNKIKAIIIESKSGRQAITGKMFIDGTGDGDIAYFAGCSYTKGREADGLTQSMGSRFRIGNVNIRNPEEIKKDEEIVLEAIKSKKIHARSVGFIKETGSTIRSNEITPDTTRRVGDGTNVRDLTRCELQIRKDTLKIFNFLKENVPGFENSHLIDSPFQVGVRETRQIEGISKLSTEDVTDVKKYPETTIARGCWWVDIHCPLGRLSVGNPYGSLCSKKCNMDPPCIMKQKFPDELLKTPFLPPSEYFDISYGCIVAKDIDNLFLSGRCISASHQAMASARVIGTCFAIGEAAGTASAMCLKGNVKPKDLNVTNLQEELRKNGVPL
jgi:hypothetical protein